MNADDNHGILVSRRLINCDQHFDNIMSKTLHKTKKSYESHNKTNKKISLLDNI